MKMFLEGVQSRYVTELSLRIEIPRAVLNRAVKAPVPIRVSDIWEYINGIVNLAKNYPVLELTDDILSLSNIIYQNNNKIKTQDAIILSYSIFHRLPLFTADSKLVDSLKCRCNAIERYPRLKRCVCDVKGATEVEIILAKPQ
ncbi:MAG: hypothetical protein ACP5MH_12165 [Thermoproteus sp.]